MKFTDWKEEADGVVFRTFERIFGNFVMKYIDEFAYDSNNLVIKRVV
jgi:hypothetical protein